MKPFLKLALLPLIIGTFYSFIGCLSFMNVIQNTLATEIFRIKQKEIEINNKNE